MHRGLSIYTFLSGSTAAELLRDLALAVADGGSVVTKLLATFPQQGSWLHRRWVIINDASGSAPDSPKQPETADSNNLHFQSLIRFQHQDHCRFVAGVNAQVMFYTGAVNTND